MHNPDVIYHAANKLLRTNDRGITWEEISPDLTKNKKENLGPGGGPITNEGAGGEVYHTIYYVAESPHDKDIIYAGADDGLVHITMDGGKNWSNITPDLEEGMINSIDISPHDPATVYIAFNRYKFDDFKPYVLKSTNYGKTWKVYNNGIEKNSFVRVVREDNVKKGLLYAGTERGIYISIDGGENWTKWQRNLPIVPITDLKVHKNDLVIATQGRGFWIYDDLTPIHEFSEELNNKNVHMFEVEDNHKVLFSAMRRQGPLGKNPYYGTEIKYFIRDYNEEDSLELKVEIRNNNKDIIRTFSSNGKYNSNRVIIKEGYASIKWGGDVEGFIPPEGVMVPRGSDGYMSSYNVKPGNYSVVFSYGDYKRESSFSILPDPRHTTSAEDFDKKENLLNKIHSDVNDIYESLTKMQDARSQIKDLQKRLGSEFSDIVDLSKETLDLINDTELKLISPKQKTFQDVINFRNQLDAQLMDLLSTVNRNIPPITNGQLDRFEDLHSTWLEIRVNYDKILSNINSINSMLIESSVPYISKGQ